MCNEVENTLAKKHTSRVYPHIRYSKDEEGRKQVESKEKIHVELIWVIILM